MRKYQPIWELLKQFGECSIAADPRHHARIKKAVIKEKYQDFGDKFHKGEYWKKARLAVEVNGSTMNFKLSVSIGTDDL